MNKTTEALKLAEEALYAELESDTCEEFAEAAEKCHKALAAIREALAEQSVVLNDPHPPHRLCECTACLEYWTPLPDCDAFAGGGNMLAEPVKQEPVAVISESAIGLVKLHSNGACLPFGTQLYAAPVDAKPCKECGAKQAQIDRLMLEYCPDEMTHEQMQEWERNIKPFVEPVKQEPVAMYCSYPNCTCINPTLCRAQNADPVDAKAIRAEALEEAANVCEQGTGDAVHANTEFAAGIRGLK